MPIMHERGGETPPEAGLMEMRKIPAFGKTMLINGAFPICQEMAWNTVDNHLSALALFDVPGFGFADREVQMPGQSFYFRGRHVHHQRAAAISTFGAINHSTHCIVQHM